MATIIKYEYKNKIVYKLIENKNKYKLKTIRIN